MALHSQHCTGKGRGLELGSFPVWVEGDHGSVCTGQGCQRGDSQPVLAGTTPLVLRGFWGLLSARSLPLRGTCERRGWKTAVDQLIYG